MAEFKIHFPPVSSTKTLEVYIPRTYAISKTTLQAHEQKWENFRSRAEWKITATCFLVGRKEVMGYEVVQLEEALRYMPEGRAFDFRWSYQDFSLT